MGALAIPARPGRRSSRGILPWRGGNAMHQNSTTIRVFVLVATALAAGCQYAETFAPGEHIPAAGTGAPSEPTVAAVYQRAEQTLRAQPGKLYHATIQIEADLGFVAYDGTRERWVEAARNVAREEADLGRLGVETSILTEEARYNRSQDGRFTVTSGRRWTCNDTGVAASAVLGCPGATEHSTTEVQHGAYAGRPVLILVTTGASSGSDQTFTFTRRLYLDPDTALPLAMESDGEVDFGEQRPTRERRVYRHEFVATDGLPASFFDPVSIGYKQPDPEDAFRQPSADLPVFWLGPQFGGMGGLPALVLGRADASEPGRGPGYRYRLQYAREDDPFGPPVVVLELWPRAGWDSFLGDARGKGSHMWDDPCWTREDIVLGEGQATLFSGFDTSMARVPGGQPPDGNDCPARPYDTFRAHATLGETVIVVTAPGVSGVNGVIASPYGTRAGMEAVVRALRPRQH